MKYIGSKAKFADEIVAILQGYISEYKIKQYVEPFAGGFNIIDKIQCEYRLGNDIDPLVCDLIETCRDNPALLDSLHTPTREEYYDVRDNKGNYAAWYRAAVLLFASYNSRVYGGCYGATAQTKDGKTRNYFEESKQNFQRQLPALRNILVGNADYRDLHFPTRERVLIYCDPPYSTGRRLWRRKIRHGGVLGLVQTSNSRGAYRDYQRIHRSRRFRLYLGTQNKNTLKQPRKN